MMMKSIKIFIFVFGFAFFMLSSAHLNSSQSRVELAQKIADLVVKKVQERYEKRLKKNGAGTIATRDAHAKAHACLKASFQTFALQYPYAAGIFSESKTYPAWIRYSNSNAESRDDRKDDVRGMGIKLTGVAGTKFLEDEVQTQDFLLGNSPNFFVKNVESYLQLFRSMDYFGDTIGPIFWALTGHRQEAALISKQKKAPKLSLFETNYYSKVPFRLGTEVSSPVVKYKVEPCQGQSSTPLNHAPDMFQRDLIEKFKAKKQGCFYFYLQVQTDPVTMPIEDATIIWPETKMLLAAKIIIPPQVFHSPAQMEFCENLSFDPWHSRLEHRPLGELNEVRKVVYQAVSKKRHELNEQSEREPTGKEEF